MAPDQYEAIKQVAAMAAEIERESAEIDPQLFHEARAEAVAKLMERGGFTGKDAPFRYAPEAAKREAHGRYLAEVEGQIATRLGLLDDTIRLLAAAGQAREAVAAEPPSAEDAFRRLHNLAAVERGQAVNLAILDELRVARLHKELLDLPPSAVLARYEKALEAPLEGEQAATIRLVEQLAAAKRLPMPKKTDEAGNLAKIEKRIAEVRASRLPDGLKGWREAVARGRKTLQRAELGGLKPRKAGA